MPIYEYRCQACDQVVEIIHSMSDSSPRTCETCGAELERLISRSSFALKGDGWYADLYSSSKKGKGAGSDKSASSESSSSSSSGSSDSSSSGSSSSSSAD